MFLSKRIVQNPRQVCALVNKVLGTVQGHRHSDTNHTDLMATRKPFVKVVMISQRFAHSGQMFQVNPAVAQINRRALATYNEHLEREELLQYKGGQVDIEKNSDTGIAVVTLNHPERRNAMSGKMMVELSDIIKDLETWKEGKGVLLRGAEGSFCSGGDLDLMRNIADPVSGSRMCLFMQNTLSRLHQLPLVSVALIQGQALGGGAELAISCDFRLVTERMSMGFVQVKMGVSPGWGGGARLVKLAGETTALKLLSSGICLSWKKALEMGLASAVAKEDEGLDATDWAQQWMKDRLQGAPQVVQAAKLVVLNAISDHHWQEKMAREKDIFASVWGGPAHHDAMNSRIKHN